MAHFLKPPGNTASGYDVDNKLAPGSVWRLRIPLGEYRDIALYGGQSLTVTSNNPNVMPSVSEIEMVRSDRRTFRLTPGGEGTTMVETKDAGGGLWVVLQVQCESNGNQAFLGNPVSGFDATHSKRLINFAARSAELQPAHRAYLNSLVNTKVRGNVVSDVFINGYAHNDKNIGLARANAVAAEFTRLAPWLAGNITISAVNDAPLRASKGGNDGYWRGVDVLVYMEKKNVPVPPSPHRDETPPMPGPQRYFDWEVYGEWGCSFNVFPGAMISLNAYHFRLQGNKSHGVWCGSVQFGTGQSVDILKAVKLARLVKAAGVNRIISLLKHVPAGPLKQKLLDSVMGFLKTLSGSISEPSYTAFSAVTPFAASDLNGATAYGENLGGGAVGLSYSVAHLSVTQKMPQYELKFIDTRTPPHWIMVRHNTVTLFKDVDVGGWAGGIPEPSAGGSGQFVGGPLITF